MPQRPQLHRPRGAVNQYSRSGGCLLAAVAVLCLDCWTPVLRCLAGAVPVASSQDPSTPAAAVVHTCRARRQARPCTQNLATAV